MKIFVAGMILLSCAFGVLSQSDLQKMVDAEHAFAKLAAEKGNKFAFLQYATSDAVEFVPDRANAREYWSNRADSAALLSWAPNYADISSNGIIGYTAGNWEYRAKGAADTPAYFGEFITVWVRQPDGGFKWVLDMGVDHDKPAKYSTDWTTSKELKKDANEQNSSAADSASGFYTTTKDRGLKSAYDAYAVDDARFFRDGSMPMIGKKEIGNFVGKDKATYAFGRRSTFFGSADIAYNLNTYERSKDGKVIEKGNTMQIWKLVRGRWRIVLDVFKPVK